MPNEVGQSEKQGTNVTSLVPKIRARDGALTPPEIEQLREDFEQIGATKRTGRIRGERPETTATVTNLAEYRERKV